MRVIDDPDPMEQKRLIMNVSRKLRVIFGPKKLEVTEEMK
jgi:hypothetical protein